MEQRSREQNIEIIRETAIKANSGLIPNAKYQGVRPVRLADVLLAINTKSSLPDNVNIDRNGGVDTTCQWNLRADNLTEQSDECLEFLAALLNQ